MFKKLKDYFNPQAGVHFPSVIEREGPVERTYDPLSRLLKERIISLTGPIDENMALSVNAQLRILDNMDPKKEITLQINSPGGSISAGLSILDTMREIEAPVATYGMGMCASMGSFLLSAGHPGMRYISPNCEVMVHQPRTQGGGNGVTTATDHTLNAEHIARIRARMEMFYAHFMGLDPVKHKKMLHNLMERDTFVNSSIALKLGLVDEMKKSDKIEKDHYFKAEHEMVMRLNEEELGKLHDEHPLAIIKDVIAERERHLASKGKAPTGPRVS